MNKKYIFIIIIVTTASFIFFNSFFLKKTESDSLVIGVMNGWPPYMLINHQGNMEGFDIDIIKEIEKIIDKKIIIKDLGSLSSLFIALEQESVDAIFSGLDVTTKRKECYDYILYGEEETPITEHCVISKKNGPQNKIDLENNNYKIGLESGLSWESTLNQYPLIEKIYSNSIADMILQLENNKIDCFIIDIVQCNRLKEIIPNLNYFVIDIDSSISIDGIGIFLKKNNITLKALLKNAIEKLRNDSIIKNIAKKWHLI